MAEPGVKTIGGSPANRNSRTAGGASVTPGSSPRGKSAITMLGGQSGCGGAYQLGNMQTIRCGECIRSQAFFIGGKCSSARNSFVPASNNRFIILLLIQC